MTARESLTGIVLDEELTLSLDEVCEVCGVHQSVVIEMVAEGIAEPVDETSTGPEFSGIAVTRLMTAFRLQRDLHINLAGAALALELLDEITILRRNDGGGTR
jgi:chaperone modulatory protein CbpM